MCVIVHVCGCVIVFVCDCVRVCCHHTMSLTKGLEIKFVLSYALETTQAIPPPCSYVDGNVTHPKLVGVCV